MANTIIPVFTSTIEIVVPSLETNNSLCMFIETAPPGGGPPQHKHLREDEAFHVLEGSFEFFDGGSWIPFNKGESRVSTRGSYHAFRNVGDGDGRMLAVVNGGGIDEYFKHLSELKLPGDLKRLQEISAFYGYYYQPEK